MIDLPRRQVQTRAIDISSARPRIALKAGYIVPILFVLFGAWGAMMALPAFRALSVGIALTDQISVLEHGHRVLRPVWLSALPGVSLGLAGMLGAAWAFCQYRLPEPDLAKQN